MSEFQCPKCETWQEYEGDSLQRATDEDRVECEVCGWPLMISWSATFEARPIEIPNNICPHGVPHDGPECKDCAW
jgi:hypothetical protein